MLIQKNRHEYYLAVISGNDYPTFPPKIREEQYLAKLAGREVDVPIPKTPKERAYYNIINDIKFEPENRWQTFVAAANDDSITAPIPRTREEIWWSTITLSQEVIVEYTGTLPATLTGTEAGYLENYAIYGNTVQDGTPTPESPIVPSGCGVGTRNLFDGEYPEYAVEPTIKYRPIYVGQGTFTLSTTFPQMTDFADLFLMAGNVSTGATTGNDGVWSERPITVESIDGYVTVGYRRYSPTHPNLRYYQTMLNSGSTALPYEPYGYKLPLTVNGVEYPIYLGESQTTRKIRKLVLTGEEQVLRHQTIESWFYILLTDIIIDNLELCTHYKPSPYTPVSIRNGEILVTRQAGVSNKGRVIIRDTAYTTEADIKSYLAQQHANGTPVTVWYVLAEPETGVVNEPLMKIGDYADAIDSTQSTVQIPTAAGTTVIDYDGEPKPNNVELTYKSIKKIYISADDKVYQDPNGQLLGG